MSKRDKQDLVFKALSDSKRREILDFLKKDAKTTGDLCGLFPHVDRCTVLQHLNVLEQAGLILVKREGRVRWNYLDVAPIQEVYDRWISKYARSSVRNLTEFKKKMETNPSESKIER